MPWSNDDRGWVMTGLSGLACIFGASFICIDVIVRQFPGKRNWKIQDSDAFLSISLSLSFGVMLFSALYSMLPSAKNSLMAGGHTSREAAWIMIGCFLSGIVGIQVISRVLHKYVPHNVVDCEHSHEDEEMQKEGASAHEHSHDDAHDHHHHTPPAKPQSQLPRKSAPPIPTGMTQQSASATVFAHGQSVANTTHTEHERHDQAEQRPTWGQRPTLQSQITSSISKLTSGKDPSSDCEGPCYGYSDVCQQACFINVSKSGGIKAPKPTTGVTRPSAMKMATATEATPLLHGTVDQPLTRPRTQGATEESAITYADELAEHGHGSEDSSATAVNTDRTNHLHKTASHDHDHDHAHDDSQDHDHHREDHQEPEHHHHHIPTNAFLSIGLQTSIAIALHKLPEGFITYATNHANPKLGFSVFLALFIHNITEGFAMALPLYLAINNRLKAMIISFILGGLSQPLGAGVAAIWFKLAGNGKWEPSESGYGGMFAVTAGIMASVALQLFAESLDLTHSKHLCMIGACCGFAILGISSALTA